MTNLSFGGLYDNVPEYPTDKEILDNYREFPPNKAFPVLDRECWDDEPITTDDTTRPFLPILFGGLS